MGGNIFKDEVSRREALKTALKASAYSAPAIVAATLPVHAGAVSPAVADLMLAVAPLAPAVAPKIDASGTIAFVITVTNNGPSVATGVIITTQLSAGFTIVSSTPSQGPYDSGTGQWNVGMLAVLGSATLQIVITGIGSGTLGATITHSDQTDPNGSNNTVSTVVTPTTTTATTATTVPPTTTTATTATTAPPTTTTSLPTTTSTTTSLPATTSTTTHSPMTTSTTTHSPMTTSTTTSLPTTTSTTTSLPTTTSTTTSPIN